MKKLASIMGLIFLLLAFLSFPVFAKVAAKTEVDKNILMKKVSGLQIPFMENQGQIKDKSVRFYANTFAGTVFVTDKGEIVYSLIKSEPKEDARYKMQDAGTSENNSTFQISDSITKAVALRESLVYSNQRPDDRAHNTDKIKGLNKSETKVNYFKGAKEDWRTNISTWQEVSLGEVYKGVELKLKAYGKNVEKIFTVNPKGSVEDIKLKIEGAKKLTINKDGELEVETEIGTIRYTKPVAYQEVEGKRIEIDARYKMQDNNSKPLTLNSQLTYGFQVAQYDKTKPLIIDPLLASTFIEGGSPVEYAYALAIDSLGNVFVTGRTESSNYPVTPGAYDTTYNGNTDVFISKLNSSLSSLLASTFIGGSNYDSAYALALDSSDNVFISGYTYSSNYPVTPGAYNTTYNGNYDVFVSKFDSSLSSLLASTFIGGSDFEHAYALTIDFSGNVFVTGDTNSSNYPITPGAYDTTHNGNYDVFVSKFDSSLSSLLASTFIGGSSSSDSAYALAIDSSGNVFVTGDTNSSNYPTTLGAYDTTYNSPSDVFVSKVNSSLSSLLSSTFIGGGGIDYAYALAIDSSGNVFVAGNTRSTWYSYYPTTSGAYDTTHNGGDDVFVSKLNSSLSSLLASTFIGGSSVDRAHSLTIDSSGNVFVAGYTDSFNYPTPPGAYDITHNGGYDAFVSKVNSSLSSLLSSTFIGGTNYDFAYALAIDSSGNVFVAGETYSSDYPTTPGAYDTTNAYYDVFISKLDSDLSGGITCTDADGDMYAVEGGACGSVDCNDNAPLVNPGATEICDATDNNCNGSVDEGCNVDLYISSMSAPVSANSGDTILVSNTTNKSGVSLVGATTTKIYFSKDNKYSSGDTELGSRAVPVFGAGAQSSSGSTSVTIPSNACTQTYYLIARADADKVITEWNEGNNNRAIAIGITNPTPSVDLYISSVTVPGSANAGQTISADDTTNKSGSCASGASTTKIYLSTDNKYSTSDIYLGERAVGSFGAGDGNNSGITNVTIPAETPAGTYYIIVRADADKVIPEWNEGNNNRAGAITINP